MSTTTSRASRAACLCVAASLAGCAHWSTETRITEATYQVVSAVDTLQSIEQARRPDCYAENDPITRAVIGPHPHPGNAAAWGLARAGLHAWGTDALEGHRGWQRLWQAITISYEGRDVHQAWAIGLHIGSVQVPSYAPCLHP